MKKALVFLGIVLILSASMFLLAQETTKEAWRDFRVFIGILDGAESQIQQLYNQIVNIESEKAEILDDPARKAELLKIIDIHPDYSLPGISTKLTKLSTLKQYLEDNGYIQ